MRAELNWHSQSNENCGAIFWRKDDHLFLSFSPFFKKKKKWKTKNFSVHTFQQWINSTTKGSSYDPTRRHALHLFSSRWKQVGSKNSCIISAFSPGLNFAWNEIFNLKYQKYYFENNYQLGFPSFYKYSYIHSINEQLRAILALMLENSKTSKYSVNWFLSLSLSIIIWFFA